MLFSPTTRSFTFYTIACIFYGTLATLPSAQGAPQLVPIIPVTPPPVLDVNLGVRALVGDSTCPASNGNGLTGRVFAAVTLAERATVSALNVNLANIGATVRTCICVTANVAVGSIVPSTSLNAQALADIRAAAQATAGLSALNTLLGAGTNVLNVNLVPTAAVTCGNCAANQYPGCSSGTCTCINCPAGQFYSASRGVCVVSASPVARARVKARSEALALEADSRCSGGNKNGNCKRSPNVLQLRQATREAIVERYNRTLANSAARKPVRYQRLELVSQ